MIPIYQPWITDLEKEYIAKAVESSWISSQGEFIDRFEEEFASYVGAKYAITVNNGTAACHLACLACGLSKFTRCIVPNITFIASANSVKYTRSKIDICDIDPLTWNIDCSKIEEYITDRTHAIMPVHLYGNMCDMDKIEKISANNELFIIEDACEAIGARQILTGKHAGTIGDIGCFSFFGNKTITTGEGGMVVTNNEDLAEEVRLLKGQGQTHRYWHPVIGYNYRMTNVQAALGLAQLHRIETILTQKKHIYNQYLLGLKEFQTQKETQATIHGCWMFTFLLPNNIERSTFISQMRNKGIDTRPMFYPISMMPPYSRKFDDYKYPNSNSIYNRGVVLPSYPTLKQEEQEYIIETVKNLI